MKLTYITLACLALVAICQADPHHGKHEKHGMTGKGKHSHGHSHGHGETWKIMSKLFPKLMLEIKKNWGTLKQYSEYPSKVISKATGYELRCYDKAKWITTSTTVQKPQKGSRDTSIYVRILGNMIWKMVRYIRGNNGKKVAFDVTMPILHRFQHPGQDGKANFEMIFPIPGKYQADVPVPNDSSLSIIELDMCVYAHGFNRPNIVTSPRQYMHHVRMLKRFLKRDGLEATYKEGLFFSANFDSILKKENRRKEVWLQKKM